ncbi:hypothetical protein V8E53_003790 [Lactarius tabidus]
MPTRAHRPTPVRTHSRSSSGGSSKVVLNLQLTQKDPVLPKIDKARRTSHPLEPPTRTNILRTGSTVRVQSREHVPSAAPRRAATNPLPSRGSGKPKAGFTIAASTVGSDEDEWESSESGAATPLDDVSGDEGSGKKTPQEQQSPSTPVDPTAGQRGGNGQQNAAAFVPSTTPRAEPTQAQARPRVQTNGFTVRQPPPVAAPAARIPSPPKPPQQQQQQQEPYRPPQHKRPSSQPTDALQHVTQSSQPRRPSAHILDQPQSQSPTSSSPPRTPEAAVPRITGARTEPPTPTSPRSDRDRHSHSSGKARPASTRSLIVPADHTHAALRPHPLIRGQSFGHGHLAPLKVTPDAAQVQLSSSPPFHAASTSPNSVRTVHTPSPSTHFSSALFRRPSTSSAHSVATLPILHQQPLTPVERARTTSTLSVTSSSTAFSSLTHLPSKRASSAAAAAAAAAAVATAQTPPLVVHFPSQNAHTPPETVHTLLPPPYVTPHFTILQWRCPIRESHTRVARARDATQRCKRAGA